MPEFYITFARRKYFPGFFGGVVGEGNIPLAPVSYAYGWAPGPPPSKSGPGSSDSDSNLENAVKTNLVYISNQY